MAELASVFPDSLRRVRRLPLSRDQLMLLMIAVNEIFLGIDTYLSHIISGTIVPREWIPIVFGFTSGVALLIAGLIALRNRTLASVLATVTLILSIGVGLLGAYFHLSYAARPFAPAGERLTLDLLVWAPPVLGPLAFALAGVLGISAAWIESPANSGRLILWGDHAIQLPYSKTRAYFFIVGMGILAALISSVLDHARTGYNNPWLWIPPALGIFGMVVAVTMGSLSDPSRLDVWTYIIAMLLLIVLGPVGTLLHSESNLVGGFGVVIERFIRGAPFLAPLLYTNMGMLGLIALVDPRLER